jgi:uncharacterized protein (TIGR03435 family)
MLCARTLPGLLTLGVLAPIAMAQTAAGNSFDVVSVKTGGDPSRGMSMQTTPSGMSVSNVTLKYLIQYAWDVKGFQISGGPGWIDSDRFTIEAKSDARLEADHSEKYGERLHSRIPSLLADGFGLRLHTERRVMPIYELVVAGTGPKLSRAKDGAPEGWSTGRGMSKGTHVKAGTIARALSDPPGRVVIDRPGLNSYYDYSLTLDAGFGRRAEPHVSEEAAGPSLFTAVQEQLGLKLKAAKAPVEVLVIDHAEKPSAN